MKPKNFIPDGYNRPAFIAERSGLHDAIRLVYRPLRYAERQVIQDGLRGKSGNDAAQIVFKTLCHQIVSWDLKHGETVAPITVEAVAITEPVLIDRLFNVCLGFDPGDVDPMSTEAQTKSQINSELEAMLSGKSAGDVVAETSEKNLGRACD